MRIRRCKLEANDGRGLPALACGHRLAYRDADGTWTVEAYAGAERPSRPRDAVVLSVGLTREAARRSLRA